MPPPHDGNEVLLFERMIALEAINSTTFRSVKLPFTPGGAHGDLKRAYGGHIYAQAAWAACQTIGEKYVLSNISGSFILPGSPAGIFRYYVQRVRDGRSISVRTVNVWQEGSEKVIFTCTAGFKIPPPTSILDVQDQISLSDRYSTVLDQKRPEEFEDAPGIDLPWYWRALQNGTPNDTFPGLQMTKADMSTYNHGRHPIDRRQIMFYRAVGTLPKHNANLHLCAHLYASDRNSLFAIVNALDIGNLDSGISSLTHHVIFHADTNDTDFGEDQGPRLSKWFVREDNMSRFASDRGVFNSRVWSPDGKHLMTIIQDGLIRLPDELRNVLQNGAKAPQGFEQEKVSDVNKREANSYSSLL
nr:acyl-coenzyme a thioesterase 8 [Quercus suber]